ncbi:hypothetical protein SSX86_005702 [Deinandra increscens subsp. villosa]|uniref:F-box domain-containing protein n=1 Tax=Deinandra increscens subsp. villosa TaxID=3103831 RepID=A0AAP0DLQ6_9ASTR
MSHRRHASSEATLPENVTIDIISRLPIKTIISCKCVCKKWRDIVADPRFVDLHLSRSREALMIHEGKIFDWPGTLKWPEIGQEINYHLADPEVKILDLKHCAPIAGSKLCSVNGLICYSQEDGSVFVCNPILGDHMTLPRPPLGDLATVGYGFGVSREGEYKVIRISSRRVSVNPEETRFFTVEIEVYTLGTDRWRSLGETPFHLDLTWPFGGSVCLDSHVYWFPGHGHMYVFDLVTERFAEFRSPLTPQHNRGRVGVLKGSLSCISWCSYGMEVWVLKEFWHKEMDIQESIKPFLEFRVWNPLCIIDGLKDMLPEYVIFDVLSRLPVKTIIIYCKCVCKRWRGLVSDPYFVDLHLSRSREEAQMIQERALMFQWRTNE